MVFSLRGGALDIVVLKTLYHMLSAIESLFRRSMLFATGEKCGTGDGENTDDLFVVKMLFHGNALPV